MNYDKFDAINKKYKTILVDPPWQYDNTSTQNAAEKHYSTMPLKDLQNMPIKSITDESGCHLHMWTTNSFLKTAIDLMWLWGFTYKSCFVWCKPQMGMGNYWRVSHEFLLFGHTKSEKFKRRDAMSWLIENRSKHSAKPGIVRRIIEEVSPGPYLEMFSRSTADGWDLFGDQLNTVNEETSNTINSQLSIKNHWFRFFRKKEIEPILF